MTERSFAFPPDTISETAEEATTRCMLVILSFLTERGIPITDWTAFVAQRFAQFWTDPGHNWSTFVAVIQLQAGASSFALRLQTLTLPDEASLEFASQPVHDTFSTISRSDLDDIFALFHLFAQKLCMRYKWERSGDQVTMALARDSSLQSNER